MQLNRKLQCRAPTIQMAEIAKRYPQLRFDPQTGIAKLDTDILFDVGTSELKPLATIKV